MSKFFCMLLLIALVAFVIGMIKPKIIMRWAPEEKQNRKWVAIVTVACMVVFSCLVHYTMTPEERAEQQARQEQRLQEKEAKKKAEAEKKAAEEQAIAEKKAAEAEKKAQREAEKKERARHADEYVRTWCGRMRTLMNDTNEQWEYWWPIATGSGNIYTSYDAANTLSINLKQYLKSSEGENYNIPEYATDEQKNKMKEIEKSFRNGLWKRILASEKFGKELKSGKLDLSEATGISRRANEADISALEASNLLKDLEGLMGM